MAADKRDEILYHWHAVTERSGIPFDRSPTAAMRRGGFVYDAEPTCRAVVMACECWAGDDEHALTFFHTIQHVFYSEGRDTVQAGVLRDVVLANGVEAEHFDVMLNTDIPRDGTHEDFRLSRRWGITSFPNLLAEQGGTLYQIGRDYALPVALYVRAVEVLQQHLVPDVG